MTACKSTGETMQNRDAAMLEVIEDANRRSNRHVVFLLLVIKLKMTSALAISCETNTASEGMLHRQPAKKLPSSRIRCLRGAIMYIHSCRIIRAARLFQIVNLLPINSKERWKY